MLRETAIYYFYRCGQHQHSEKMARVRQRTEDRISYNTPSCVLQHSQLRMLRQKNYASIECRYGIHSLALQTSNAQRMDHNLCP